MNKFSIFTLIFLLSLLSLTGNPLPPDDSQGLTDQILLRSDGIHLNRQMTNHRQRPPGGEQQNQQGHRTRQLGLSFGANMYYSETYNIYALPISYEGIDSLVLSCSIPFVIVQYESDISYEQYGLGDISLGLSYTLPQWSEGLEIVLSTDVGLPTGKVDAVDNNQNIPLGAGSTLSYFNLALSQQINKLLIFGDISHAFYWYQADYTVVINDISTRYIIGKGRATTNFIGMEYQILSKLILSSKFYTSWNTESFVEERNPGGVLEYESNDSLIASDVILGGRWNFFRETALSLGVSIPVITLFDPDLVDPEPRTIGVSVGVSSFL